ncbi:capsule assembly Wzi family protein [Fodinibius sediminis]|uniref:Capsule assembly protein Wzi n=1 Tax=Fodinibius sediminis TaxID=1214077 RepID=A0A521ABF6_9BACT|nr:capsule assembly Wzi family protein [Fodinibius sediminis]SMO32118.1 Capsule assembly protein Wzi [Fodinibius sediminis]
MKRVLSLKQSFFTLIPDYLTATVIGGVVALLVGLLACAPQSHAQELPVNDAYNEYLRVLTISGELSEPGDAFSLFEQEYSMMMHLDSLKQHPWATIPDPVLQEDHSTRIGDRETAGFIIVPYDPRFRTYWQSLDPGGQHDGPVWQGRGFTNDLSAGFFARYRFLSVSLRPHLIFNQNRPFGLSPYERNPHKSPFAYALGPIDWPQRFGDQSFWTADWGQSYLRADYRGWASGISNEHMRWGPSRQNAILMDSNAPGFRHFFISTEEPKDIYIGHLKTKLFWGKLWESDYFDENSANDERFISGLNLSFNPKPVPGLRLGINRIFYETIPPEGIPAGDLFKIFEAFTKNSFTDDTNISGNDQSDQLLSLFGQWVFPESGLEIYGEWARTDHSWDWRDFFTEPEHSRGYTLGLQKTFTLKNDRLLSINTEITQLEASKSGAFRGYAPFYVHSRSRQGYTNRGQLLGAAIGPGSNSQYLGSSLFFDQGRIKFFVQRVAKNNDFLYLSDAMIQNEVQNPNNNKYWLHNVEMRLGTSLLFFYKQFETDIGLTYRREINHDYIFENDQNHLGVKLSIRYRLSSLR